jgi:Fur family ferric uptake transcriptional regulator
MNHKSKYNTKQYQEILDYLKSIKHSHVTAKEVYDHLSEKDPGSKIGKVTVYRQLERLVEEGVVDKYVTGQNTPACFEYIGTDDCGDRICVHGKCLKCGKLFHLHCDEIIDLREHLKEHHGFSPDFHHTVIYGVCKDCRPES